jgi:hypothetical protein
MWGALAMHLDAWLSTPMGKESESKRRVDSRDGLARLCRALKLRGARA